MANKGVHITVLSLAAAMLIAAPATSATAVSGAIAPAKKVPGRTLVVKVKGLPGGSKVRVTVKRRGVVASKRVATTKRFKNLAPGRYRVKARNKAGFTLSDRSKNARVKANRGKRVTFRYRARRAPAAVTGLQVSARTSQSVQGVGASHWSGAMAWTVRVNPATARANPSCGSGMADLLVPARRGCRTRPPRVSRRTDRSVPGPPTRPRRRPR